MIVPSNPPKNNVVAIVLSVLFPGIGQLYLGQTTKGVAVLIGYFVIGVVTLGLGFLIIWILSLIDTVKLSGKLQAGQPIGEWEFFWSK